MKFTIEKAQRMRELFGIASEHILSESEETELNNLVDTWELDYFQNTKREMANDPWLIPLELLHMVRLERQRGYEKWGTVDKDPTILLNAIIEEIGEVAHAVNHDEGTDKTVQEIAEAIGVLTRLYDMVSARG